MEVFIIERNKRKHCGFRTYGQIKVFSLCNRTWNESDIITKGYDTDVTCKRCQKLMAKADSNGVVTF